MKTYQMIDVGGKPVSAREASACGEIKLSSEVMQRVRTSALPKGDVLGLAEVAAILGVKSTAQILPLCHPLSIEGVKVNCEPDYQENLIRVTCTVSTHAKTGVEMEALSGVGAALLCIYDLTKSLDKGALIREIKLLEKKGGKSGHYIAGAGSKASSELQDLRVGILTVSDRASAGVYDDMSGPSAEAFLQARSIKVSRKEIVSDNVRQIRQALLALVKDDKLELLIVSGGTGVSPRDCTPDALEELWTRRIPGIGELLRLSGAQYTANSWLSRSEAGFVGSCLVLLLPGSPKAVEQCLCSIETTLFHALRQARGERHD